MNKHQKRSQKDQKFLARLPTKKFELVPAEFSRFLDTQEMSPDDGLREHRYRALAEFTLRQLEGSSNLRFAFSTRYQELAEVGIKVLTNLISVAPPVALEKHREGSKDKRLLNPQWLAKAAANSPVPRKLQHIDVKSALRIEEGLDIVPRDPYSEFILPSGAEFYDIVEHDDEPRLVVKPESYRSVIASESEESIKPGLCPAETMTEALQTHMSTLAAHAPELYPADIEEVILVSNGKN